MEPEPNAKRILVEHILRNAKEYPWVVPANGRLTLVLAPDSVVINLFNAHYRQPGTTTTHSHTMDFKSEIIAGEMRQYRYARSSAETPGAAHYGCQELTLDGKLMGEATDCYLLEGPREVYRSGEFYEITAPEIHRSDPEDGTVTLITRQYKTTPASVFTFWPYAKMAPGTQSGEKIIPGVAGGKVLEDAVSHALRTWF